MCIFTILSKIDDGANPLIKYSKRVKGNFLLRITYTKSQTDKSRYSTATESWSLQSTFARALVLYKGELRRATESPGWQQRARRANTEWGYRSETVVVVMLATWQPS